MERCEQYSLLGLHAHDLTVQMRKRYEIPQIANRAWNPVSRMREELQKIEELQKKRESLFETMRQSGVIPPPPPPSEITSAGNQ